MNKNIIYNKRANYNFFIKKKLIAGMILKGWEIKYIRKKNIHLEKCYVTINKKNIPFIKNINIKKINNNNNNNKYHENIKKIKILLKKKEINFLKNKIKKKEYTIIVKAIIIKNPWFKVEIALAKGKKKYDKKKK